MKVFKNKKTGRLGETQFKNDPDVLIKNAKACGISDDEIEIIDMTELEYSEKIREQNFNDIPEKERTERKIQKEVERLIDLNYREQAILNLKQKGEI